MSAVNKLIRDGLVAVLYSPGFGAGWSTWDGDHRDTLTFDSEIAQAVIDGDNQKAEEIANRKCPSAYTGGAKDLCVEWLPVGTAFEINEYDGSESIHVIGERRYLVA